jgi:hypothetical protein
MSAQSRMVANRLPDRRLPGHHRPKNRILTITCGMSSTWLITPLIGHFKSHVLSFRSPDTAWGDDEVDGQRGGGCLPAA